MTEENKNEEFSLPPLSDDNGEFFPPPIPKKLKVSNKTLYIILGIVLAAVIGIVAITITLRNKSENNDNNYYSEGSNALKDGEIGIRDQYGNEYGVQIDEDYYASLDDGVNTSSNNTSQITASSGRTSDYGYEDSPNYSSSYRSSASSSNNEHTVSSATQKNEYKVGNRITFGEQFEWLVLDVHDGKALIINVNGSSGRYYDDETEYAVLQKGNTWENSSLRKYLNEVYYNRCFTISERDRILTTDLINEDNPNLGTEGGNNTQDKIFILSASEILKYSDIILKFKSDNIWFMEYSLGAPDWLRVPGTGIKTATYRLNRENENSPFRLSINYEGIGSGHSGNYYAVMWIKTDE